MNNTFLNELLGVGPRYSWLVQKMDGFLRRFLPWVRVDSAWRGRMASIESRINLFHLLSQVIAYKIPGDIVEIGCNNGESSVVIQKIINSLDSSRKFYVYDSFGGLPTPDSNDEDVYDIGDMATSRQQFIDNFNSTNLPLPVICQGWFEDTLPSHLPDKIAFAFIDCDLYASTLICLESIYHKIQKGGICFLGVYWEPERRDSLTYKMGYKSPGVKKACDHFFEDKPEEVHSLLAGFYTTGYFRKL